MLGLIHCKLLWMWQELFIKCIMLSVTAVSIFNVFALKCNVHPVVSIVSPKSEVFLKNTSPKQNPWWQLQHLCIRDRGHVVAQLVEALRYKSEGRGFDSRWCNWNFFINPLKTNGRPLYLKTKSVPRCKHFLSRLQKPISLCCKWHKSLFVLR